ncbi:ATP-binding cassette domain-containing protein [Xanthobacter sediminis]
MRRRRGRLSHLLHETAGGMAKIRLAAAEARAFGRWALDQAAWAKAIDNAHRVELVRKTAAAAASPLMQGVIFAVIVYAGLADAGFGLGAMVAFLAAFSQLSIGMTAIAKAGRDMMALAPIFAHAGPILHAVPESPVTRLDPGPLDGGIEINQVTFRHGPDGPPILSDFSLQVERGDFVALVGPSGSGKSTVLRLLLGFETAETGAVPFDGEDLRSLDVHAVHRQMGSVLQNGQLFTGSLLENILGGHEHLTQEDAWRAAEQAGLAEDIRAMPMGLHTVCSGGGLSGGQIQRVMIARALVHRPQTLLFDEATSAPDNRTQAAVTRSLSRMRATRIVVVRDGRVVESGSFDELLARGGLFSEACRAPIGLRPCPPRPQASAPNAFGTEARRVRV